MSELRPASVLQSNRLEGCLFLFIFLSFVLCFSSACLFTLVHEGTLAIEMLNDVAVCCRHLVSPLHRVLLRFCGQNRLFLKLLVGRDFGRFPNSWLFRFLIRLGLELVDVEASEPSR